MEEPTGIAALGINAHTLIIQIVNFGILFVLLRLFAYKPILKMLKEREEKVTSSLKLAEDNQKKAIELEEQIKKGQEEARKNAKQAIDQAQMEAEKLRKEIKDHAQREADDLMKLAETKIKQQKEELKSELRAETADLVIASVEKILSKNLSDDDKKKLVNDAVKEIK